MTTATPAEQTRLKAFGRITKARRMINSVQGNPRYSITVTMESGQSVTVRTSPDSALAYRYTFTNMIGDYVTVEYTRSGVLKDATHHRGA